MKYKKPNIFRFQKGGLTRNEKAQARAVKGAEFYQPMLARNNASQVSSMADRMKAMDPRNNLGAPAVNMPNQAINNDGLDNLERDRAAFQASRRPSDYYDPSQMTRSQAFAQAHKAGLKEFSYGNDRIAVKFADDPVKAPTAPTAATAPVDNTTYISNTPLSELIVTGNAPVRNDTTYASNTPLQEVVVTAPRTVKPVKQSWWQQLREANTPERIAERRRAGLGIRSRQRGGILDKRDQLLINPRYGDAQLFGTGKGNTVDLGDGTSVNRYTNMRPFGGFRDITTLSGDPEQGIPGAIRTITGRVDAGGVIQKPDTTITSTRFGEYLKNKPTGFFKKKKRAQFDSEAARFNRADSIAAGRYQQGGALPSEEKSIPEALIADFVVRFLVASGFTEDQILDSSGQGFSAEAQKVALPALEQIGEDPQFWQAYQQDPEGTIGQISQSPEQVAMARKGARLEILRKGGKKKKMKSRKCKCGCEITTVKEEGGKLSSKCACGCK